MMQASRLCPLRKVVAQLGAYRQPDSQMSNPPLLYPSSFFSFNSFNRILSSKQELRYARDGSPIYRDLGGM
jgi:hypothetical protein